MIFSITKKKLFKAFAIVILIPFGILLGAEGLLRIIYPEKVNNIKVGYEFNESFLVQLKPNISKVFTRKEENGGDIIHWKTNKEAFRGAEINDDSKYRVMVYGDSNIQARFSNETNTFTGQLDHYLSESGLENVEVINAGVIGFGPDQSLIRFELEADKYMPNLVIFHVFSDNDFGDIIRNRLFDLDENGKLINTTHKKTVDMLLQGRKENNYKLFFSQMLTVRAMEKITLGSFGKNPATKDLVSRIQKRGKAEYLIYKKSKPNYFSHFEDHYDLDIALDPEQESSQVKIKLMNEVLKNANTLADAKGIKFLVIIQPSIIDLTTGNYALSYEYLQKYKKYKRSNLSDEVEKICSLQDIHYVNLFDVFSKNSPENLYFTGGDNHWNDQGQKIAAEQTKNYILHNALCENMPAPEPPEPPQAGEEALGFDLDRKS